MDDEHLKELDQEDLEEQDGELLPEREQMSVVDLGEGGGLAPPPMDTDPYEITPDRPPTE
jgi:hypothetical protein